MPISTSLRPAAKDGVLATWTLPTTTTATCTHQSAAGQHPFSFPGTYTVRVLSTVDKNGGGGFLNPVAVQVSLYRPGPNGTKIFVMSKQMKAPLSFSYQVKSSDLANSERAP